MPRSAIVRTIHPVMISDVLHLLRNIGKEHRYNGEEAIFIRECQPANDGSFIGSTLIDVKETVLINRREGGEITREPQNVIRVVQVPYAYIPCIDDPSTGNKIEHVILVLCDAWSATLFFDAINKVLKGKMPFTKLTFVFNSSNEAKIRNQFDDIIRIRGDDIVDVVVSGLAISGSRLYQSQEYQKVLSGEIKYIGVPMGDDTWYMLNSSGRITTYRAPSDSDFIRAIQEIIVKLICADAVR